MTREELNARVASIEADIVDVVKEAIDSGIHVGMMLIYAHTNEKLEDFDGEVTSAGEDAIPAATLVNFLLSDGEDGKECRNMVIKALKHYAPQVIGEFKLDATPKQLTILKATKLKS